MQKMKFKICLFVLLAVASVAQGQSFRDIEGLKEMRKDLQTEDSLMRLGILKDEATGLPSFWGWSLLGHFCEFEDTLEQDITIIEH